MSLIKNSAFYTVVGVLPQLFGFILLPFISKSLSVADYGKLSTVEAILFILSAFLCLGLERSVIRELSEHTDTNIRRNIFSTIFYTALISLVGFMFSIMFLAYWFYPKHLATASVLSLLAGFRALILLFARYHQSGNFLKGFAVSQLPRVFLEIVLLVLLVIVFDYGVEGYVIALCIASFLSFVIVLVKFHGILRMFYKFDYVISALKISIPFIPASILAWVLNLSDRFFLIEFQGYEDLGNYGMGYKIATALSLVYVSIQLAYASDFFRMYREANYSEINRKVKLIFSGQLFFFSTLALFTAELFYFLDRKYFSANVLVIFIGFSFYASSLIGVTSNLYFQQQRKTFIHMLIFAGVALVSLVLNYVFVKKYSYYGAVLTAVIANVILTTIHFLKAKQLVSKELSPPVFLFLFYGGLICVITFLLNSTVDLSFQFFFTKLVMYMVLLGVLYKKLKI